MINLHYPCTQSHASVASPLCLSVVDRAFPSTDTMSLDIQTVFDLYKSGAGCPADQVGTIVRSQGLCPTTAQVNAALGQAGVSPGGSASLAQVQSVVSALQHTKPEDIEQSVREALGMFDDDGAEVVKMSDLTHVLKNLGDKMSAEDIDNTFRSAEVDGFGQLDINEFARLVMREVGQEDNALA
eukprot:m.352825 g.352825  ORF g.352825 m.352825 type:complete len:184 (+) comp16618_c0_seq1:277-828(+)